MELSYLVSDNTGSSIGGSDGRHFKGHVYETTKKGDIEISNEDMLKSVYIAPANSTKSYAKQ